MKAIHKARTISVAMINIVVLPYRLPTSHERMSGPLTGGPCSEVGQRDCRGSLAEPDGAQPSGLLGLMKEDRAERAMVHDQHHTSHGTVYSKVKWALTFTRQL
jgi:hypothetical protein